MQNSEQSEETLWSRITTRSSSRAKDELYKLYGISKFKDLVIDEVTDPALAKFVKETQLHGPRFSNYPIEKLNQFVDRIYELRKDNTNNASR